MKAPSIIYLEGRPHAHPMHRRFAQAVGCEIDFVDAHVRWQDLNRGFIFNLFAWISNARFLAKKYRDCDYFLIDNLHFTPIIMNFFFKKKKRMIVHLGSHTLYFMYSNRFSFFNNWLHKFFLSKYDALICEGEMAAALVKNILGKRAPKSFVVFNGIPNEHLSYSSLPDLTSKKILFLGNGPGKERLWYKGLDLMIKSFEIALRSEPHLQFIIVGNWEQEIIDELLYACTEEARRVIFFEKATPDLSNFIKQCALNLHCARGEAYGVTILIALANGLPAIVSEWTGAKEVVSQVDDRLVAKLDAEEIAQKIVWYLNLKLEEKSILSLKGASIASRYTEKNAIIFYQSKLAEIYSEL